MKITRENFNFEVIDHDFWKDDQWETFTYQCVQNFSDKNKTFIDIGAWIGPISLVASKLNKNCYACEPDPLSFSQLTENIKLNNITNISPHNIAITNKTRMLTLGNDEKMGTSNTRLNATANLFQVEGKSLKEFVGQLNVPNEDISMVKLDTEGAELEILEDEFFRTYNGPLHLSIHVPFFTNPMEDALKIKRFISKYSYFISDTEFINSNPMYLEHFNGFYSVMLYN